MRKNIILSAFALLIFMAPASSNGKSLVELLSVFELPSQPVQLAYFGDTVIGPCTDSEKGVIKPKPFQRKLVVCDGQRWVITDLVAME